METEYNCPWVGCRGVLDEDGEEETLVGCLEFNTNAVTESFVCSTCGRRVSRSWKWRDAEGNHAR